MVLHQGVGGRSLSTDPGKEQTVSLVNPGMLEWHGYPGRFKGHNPPTALCSGPKIYHFGLVWHNLPAPLLTKMVGPTNCNA